MYWRAVRGNADELAATTLLFNARRGFPEKQEAVSLDRY
jgi:hypothetical protein